MNSHRDGDSSTAVKSVKNPCENRADLNGGLWCSQFPGCRWGRFRRAVRVLFSSIDQQTPTCRPTHGPLHHRCCRGRISRALLWCGRPGCRMDGREVHVIGSGTFSTCHPEQRWSDLCRRSRRRSRNRRRSRGIPSGRRLSPEKSGGPSTRPAADLAQDDRGVVRLGRRRPSLRMTVGGPRFK